MSVDTDDSYGMLLDKFYEEFPKDNPGKIYTRVYKERPEQPTNAESVYVVGSVFVDCSTQGEGGAISYSGGKLLIEYSTFIRCHTEKVDRKSNAGGAIAASRCDFLLNCVCGFECYARDDHCKFSSVRSQYHTCFVISSSISLTPESGNGIVIIYFDYAKQYCNSVNCSHNIATVFAGIALDHGEGTPFITYCSFDSNIATSYTIVGLLSSSQVDTIGYEANNCNFINNTQESSLSGIVSCTAQTTIRHCSFYNNTDDNLISSSQPVTIIDCTLPEGFVEKDTITISREAEESFINELLALIREENCFPGIQTVKPNNFRKTKAVTREETQHFVSMPSQNSTVESFQKRTNLDEQNSQMSHKNQWESNNKEISMVSICITFFRYLMIPLTIMVHCKK